MPLCLRLRPATPSVLVLTVLTASACVDTSPTTVVEEPRDRTIGITVDLATPLARVEPHAFGTHASVYHNGLHQPAVPELRAVGDYVGPLVSKDGDIVGPTRVDGLGNQERLPWSRTPWSSSRCR
jgi:hypothetical protein